jgi:Uma2 family endonuclease
MIPQIRTCVTVEEYLEIEEKTEARNEYRDGLVVEVSPSNIRHARAAQNVRGPLWWQLRRTPWEVFGCSMRIRTPDRRWYLYPDTQVADAPPQLEDSETTLLNPRLIVEVISPKTEEYDRGTKVIQYRTIPSLAEYVLVDQKRVHVEHFLRQENNRWLMTELSDLAQTLELPSIGCRLPLMDIYHRVL